MFEMDDNRLPATDFPVVWHPSLSTGQPLAADLPAVPRLATTAAPAPELSEPVSLRATILYVDVHDFTGLLEQYPPGEIVPQLNRAFQRFAEIIAMHGGRVNNTMGDAILAAFETEPFYGNHAAILAATQGLKAALEIHRALNDLNAAWQAEGRPVFQLGMGLHSGTVVRMPSPVMAIPFEATLLGDAINVAARLQSLCKTLQSVVLVSGDAARLMLPGARQRLAPLGPMQLRGRRVPVEVYVLLPAAAADHPPE